MQPGIRRQSHFSWGGGQSGLASITWMDTALNPVKMNMGDMGAQ
ncbi:MAG: hypothetical protein Q8L07_07665 [Sediminibacterium sp.]|nr:hypothetical protein [Sediminibacterium sp.]